MTPALRLVFWETTKACNLSCRHCRAVPQRSLGPMELTTSRAFDLIDEIARVAKPVMVLSGDITFLGPEADVQRGVRVLEQLWLATLWGGSGAD